MKTIKQPNRSFPQRFHRKSLRRFMKNNKKEKIEKKLKVRKKNARVPDSPRSPRRDQEPTPAHQRSGMKNHLGQTRREKWSHLSWRKRGCQHRSIHFLLHMLHLRRQRNQSANQSEQERAHIVLSLLISNVSLPNQPYLTALKGVDRPEQSPKIPDIAAKSSGTSKTSLSSSKHHKLS